jgi:hypothetical protein
VNAAQLLPATRDLYSRFPETYHLQPWELQHVLYSLNYTDDLADEAEIASSTGLTEEFVRGVLEQAEEVRKAEGAFPPS